MVFAKYNPSQQPLKTQTTVCLCSALFWTHYHTTQPVLRFANCSHCQILSLIHCNKKKYPVKCCSVSTYLTFYSSVTLQNYNVCNIIIWLPTCTFRVLTGCRRGSSRHQHDRSSAYTLGREVLSPLDDLLCSVLV